ncbi:MAG TPA: helix-turn-helix domain-containing protein [Acidimicrobiales bacterium]|nr:helix-turn-helix domain-containing protein [Acidimicrobiales bacterium]
MALTTPTLNHPPGAGPSNCLAQQADPAVERLGYTVDEACQTIPCSRSHLVRAMRKGHIRYAKAGAKILISRQAIIDYIERGDGTVVGDP